METPMSNNPTKRGTGDQGYELRYFARKHGLTTAQANDLIRRIGNNRGRLNEAAVRLRRSLSGAARPEPRQAEQNRPPGHDEDRGYPNNGAHDAPGKGQ
jgi:hypothetical protein